MNREKFIVVLLVVVFLSGCATEAEPIEEMVEGVAVQQGRVERFQFYSQSLEGNLFGDNPERTIQVYLPPGYDSNTDRRYAVIYYLSGFGIGPGEFFDYYAQADLVMDEMISQSGIEPCILVGISGRNRFTGSFYVNSSVSGNWEDFVIEVVEQVDQNYRTLARKESRGITGFSMGGFGSLYVGLRHADLFEVVHAYSPGLFGAEGFNESVWQTWKDWPLVLRAYGAAFTPHNNPLDRDSFDFPSADLTEEQAVELWQHRWSHGYGDIEIKVDAYLAEPHRLSFIQIDYAAKDDYPWLIDGSRHFYNVLQERNIPSGQRIVPDYYHVLDEFIVKNYILSFFSDHLSFE